MGRVNIKLVQESR